MGSHKPHKTARKSKGKTGEGFKEGNGDVGLVAEQSILWYLGYIDKSYRLVFLYF